MKNKKNKSVDIDPDSISTTPINKLAVLRAEARAAVAFWHSFSDLSSPEAEHACIEAKEACERANAELMRLCGNKKTRYGNWRTPSDIELMALGYL